MDFRKRWKYERDHGVIHMAPAEPVQEHILSLGIEYAEIARQVGVHSSAIEKLARGGCERTHASTARKVLALQVPMDPLKVPQIGVQRRLGALLRMQWSHREMNLRGVRSSVLLHQKVDWVYRSTHERVSRLYDELEMQVGPSARSATWAIKAGFYPPLAWDPETIDDPFALPYSGVDHRNKREDYEHLIAAGESKEHARKRVGVTAGGVEKWYSRKSA